MSKPKIMIVDDDEDLHTLYTLYLQSQDFDIVRAFNGQQALEMVEKENPDIIVLDMIMPVMDGEEFYVKLRKEKNSQVPVIIASVNDKIPQTIYDAGAIYSNLKKPFTIETLVGKIQEALAKQK